MKIDNIKRFKKGIEITSSLEELQEETKSIFIMEYNEQRRKGKRKYL